MTGDAEMVARSGSKTSVPTGGRNGFLDAIRGVAMAGIVLGHVIVGVSDAGFSGASFAGVNLALYLVHVPLFAFVSGLMLSGSAMRRARWPFLVDRVGSLLWLYLVWTAIQGAFELLANPLRNNKTSIESILDLWTPIGHLWFLTWLAISTAVALTLRPWLGGLIRCGILVIMVVLSLALWGYEGTSIAERGIALIGIYLLGAALTHKRFVRIVMGASPTRLTVSVVASGCLFALVVVGAYFSTPSSLDPDRTMVSVGLGVVGTLAGMVAVMGFVLVLDRIGLRLRLLQWIGRNTMPIFLLHIIFAAGTRIFLVRMGINEAWIHVVLATFVGVLVPLLLSGQLYKVRGLLSAPWPQLSRHLGLRAEYFPSTKEVDK